jgi:hypothetical protein
VGWKREGCSVAPNEVLPYCFFSGKVATVAVGTTFKPAVLKPNKVSFLLRLKSWQLFIPIALSIAIQAFAELSFTNQAELPPFYEIYTTASMALLMGMLFSWLWGDWQCAFLAAT